MNSVVLFLAPCIKQINCALLFPSDEILPQSLIASTEDFFAALHKESSILASQRGIKEFLILIFSKEWTEKSEKQETKCMQGVCISTVLSDV